jgi:hypothetical protein
MGFVFRLEDYPRYLQRVGDATYIDVTRRTDPARIDRVWANLDAVIRVFGAPWIVQIWTKDAGGVLNRGGEMLRRLRRQGTTLAAQVTVTGLGGTEWEPEVPREPFAGVADLMALLGGPQHISWRYDPIIPTVHQPERFLRVARHAADLGITRGNINFLAPPGRYKRVDRRLAPILPSWSEGIAHHHDTWQVEIATQLADLAADLNLRLAVCAESAALARKVPGLAPAACGDHDWFVALSGQDPGRPSFQGSRPGCGCAAYFDVGLYGQHRRCHGCLYCYAG